MCFLKVLVCGDRNGVSSKHSQEARYSHDLSRYLHRTQNYTTCSHVSAAVSACFADFLENGTMSVRTDYMWQHSMDQLTFTVTLDVSLLHVINIYTIVDGYFSSQPAMKVLHRSQTYRTISHV